jgi:peptidoglycan/xylan/chitin deacetylase (PgdA/CDA1 family)
MKKRIIFLALALLFALSVSPAAFADYAGTYTPGIPISGTIDPGGDSGYAVPVPPIGDLTDGASSWAREGIREALEKGFVPLDLAGSYTDTITRAEFCRLAVSWIEYVLGEEIGDVVEERGLPERAGHSFSDTGDAGILAAYRLGVTGGTTAPTATTPGIFNPDGQFSREQAAAMIMNTCRAIGARVSNPRASGFADIRSASGWAVNGIYFVRAYNIMAGTSGGNFGPKITYTREQSIVTFNNIKPEVLPKQPADNPPEPNESSSLLIALTFDDGPDLTYTSQVLDKLDGYGIVATFFVVGNLITDETGHLVKRAFDTGHDIENHSWSHMEMAKRRDGEFVYSPEEIVEEIEKTSAKIKETVGILPSFFRPPFFSTGMHMRNLVDLPFIMAGIDPNDWAPRATAERIADIILDGAEDGGIILLHDAGGDRTQTVESLDLFIPQLIARGYRFVTISQLYELKGAEPRIWNGQWDTKVP